MYYSALIGKPTKHSVSPLLFERVASLSGIDRAYQHLKIDVDREELADTLRALNTLHFAGVNVTLPYKIDVMQYLILDASAEDVGAVNTIKLGKINIGYNTDWYGLYRPLREHCEKAPLKTALVLGSGGAAMAALYACKKLGINKINMACRDITNTRQRLSLTSIEKFDYTNISQLVHDSDLIINATSAGMVDNEPTPFDLNALAGLNLKDKIFFDAVFNPVNTPMLQFFSKNGSVTIDGLWMMIYQALSAIGIWTGHEVKLKKSNLLALHELLKKEIESV